MKRCINSGRRITATLLTSVVLATSGSVFAQSVDDVLKANDERLVLAKQSQERINDVVDGTRSMEDDYRAINKEVDGLRVYNRLMTAQTQGQEAVLDDISLSLEQVDMINRQIFPLMERMIDGIEQSVALDVPFLMEERADRVQNLKDIMERSDVSVAEKFRKVMEAYQIENDYGSSAEWYREQLTLDDGTTRDNNILRIGRVGLYFQSDDTQISGYWDNAQRAWVIDNSARNEIRTGLRMAKQLIAPELIIVPVAAPTEAS